MKIELPDEFFNKEELENTPRRVENFYKELVEKHVFKFTCFPNENPTTHGIVVMSPIPYTSLCSHHLLPFDGVVHIGYIPGELRCGASKLVRVVESFASKPNVQEVLVNEIANFLQVNLNPVGVIVIAVGSHKCMGCRGVKTPGVKMITSEVRGVFLKHDEGKDPKIEFFELLRLRGD